MNKLTTKALAASLALGAASSAFGATVVPNGGAGVIELSRQGNAGETAPVALGSVAVTLASNVYTANDFLYLNFGGGVIDLSSASVSVDGSASSAACDAANTTTNPEISVALVDGIDDAFQPVATGATGLRIRVTARNGASASTDTTGCRILVTGVTANRASLLPTPYPAAMGPMAPTELTANYFATFGNADPANIANRYDAASNASVVRVSDEFDFSVSSVVFNAEIAVDEQRLGFNGTGAGEDDFFDTVQVNFDPTSTSFAVGSPLASVDSDGLLNTSDVFNGFTLTIKGSRGFGHLTDANLDNVPDGNQVVVADAAGVAIPGATVLRSPAGDTLTIGLPNVDLDDISSSAFGGSPQISILAPNAGFNTAPGTAMEPQTFTVDGQYNFTGVNAVAYTFQELGFPAGEWTIDGAVIYVPAMFTGGGFNPLIFITNKSNLQGAITVEAFNQSGASCTVSAGVVGPVSGLRGSVNLGKDLNTLLGDPACTSAGVLTPGGARLGLIITVNVQAGDIDAYTGYVIQGQPASRTEVPNRKL